MLATYYSELFDYVWEHYCPIAKPNTDHRLPISPRLLGSQAHLFPSAYNAHYDDIKFKAGYS